MAHPRKPSSVIRLIPRAARRPAAIGEAGTTLGLPSDGLLYRQGEIADDLYYLDAGAMALSAQSAEGKQAIVAVHGPGVFFGANSLGNEVHLTTARALVPSAVIRISKPRLAELLHHDPVFAEQFAVHLMRRVARLEQDQIDLTLNSLEKRLARALLLMASLDADSERQSVLERCTEDMLAEMLGAVPARIGSLLRKFQRAGYIGEGEPLRVHSSLAGVLLPDHAGAAADMPPG